VTPRLTVDETAGLLLNEEVAEGFRLARLAAPHVAGSGRPGQFVEVRVRAGSEPLLRLPLSLAGVDPASGTIDLLYEVRGPKTQALGGLRAGEILRCLGPLGVGFTPPADGARVLLAGGGIGVPPLLFLGRDLLRVGGQPELLVGARTAARHLPERLLAPAAARLRLATDDGSVGRHGPVTELLADSLAATPTAMVCACGPEPMLAAVAALCRRLEIPCQVSLEAYMACGIGICVGCAVEVVALPGASPYERYRRVCVDGPVFDARVVKWRDP
jgi:dihydroorotate dehydrogenase electron transfer subunit